MFPESTNVDLEQLSAANVPPPYCATTVSCHHCNMPPPYRHHLTVGHLTLPNPPWKTHPGKLITSLSLPLWFPKPSLLLKSFLTSFSSIPRKRQALQQFLAIFWKRQKWLLNFKYIGNMIIGSTISPSLYLYFNVQPQENDTLKQTATDFCALASISQPQLSSASLYLWITLLIASKIYNISALLLLCRKFICQPGCLFIIYHFS